MNTKSYHQLGVFLLLATWVYPNCVVAQVGDTGTIERRLTHAVQYLADDRMAGRELGSPELDLAAEYIAQQFQQMGLTVGYQPFEVTCDARQGSGNQAAFVSTNGRQRMDLVVDQDFRPLALGSSGTLDSELVFVGYGITAPELEYDDYAGMDVRGKTVLILRHEPQQDQPYSLFNGRELSEYAPFSRKLQNAIDHGAAGVVFCNDQFATLQLQQRYRVRCKVIERKLASEQARFDEIATPSIEQSESFHRQVEALQQRIARLNDFAAEAESQLIEFERAGLATTEGGLPVTFVTRQAVDQLYAAAGVDDLATIESKIDDQLVCQSFAIEGWKLEANVDIDRRQIPAKNVVAVIEGDGSHGDETVVIGAHYDHLGRGRGTKFAGQVFNGADDNASGVALLLEIASHYTAQTAPPSRRVVFIAFSGEERGLLGSAHYVAHPLVPLDQTVAMFNFDMVGRLADNRLIIQGTETAGSFRALVDRVNQGHGFDLQAVPGGMGPSDHASFYGQQVPVLHFYTGRHGEYHRPSDDAHLLNVAGMRRVLAYSQQVIDEVVQAPERPAYQYTDGPSEF